VALAENACIFIYIFVSIDIFSMFARPKIFAGVQRRFNLIVQCWKVLWWSESAQCIFQMHAREAIFKRFSSNC